MATNNESQETQMRVGPLSVLKQALATHANVLIHCRNDKKLLGIIKAFDRHMNLVLENVREMWREMPRKGKGKGRRSMCKERYISKMFLRGDSIILVMKNPCSKSDYS